MTYPLYSRAFFSLLIAQFLSALADNAIFVAAIAAIKLHTHPAFYESLLQAVFLIAYIVLAPYVGPYADGHPKARVMLISNSLKVVGAALMITGVSPLWCYALIGVGAAAYSPAKYGILIEMLPKEALIKANSYLESTTIIAILFGVFFGGKLADYSLPLLFWICALTYFFASLINLLIPKTAIIREFAWRNFGHYSVNYFKTLAAFYRLLPARLSILGTTTFWSTGITLRLILFSWVPFMFMNNSNTLPANLMASVSIGIVIGAVIAAKFFDLRHAKRAFKVGLVLGPLIILIAFTYHLPVLFALMIIIGACGGTFMIPLNAIIQDSGHRTLGTGAVLAVQNFCENSGMLLFTIGYGLTQRIHMPLPHVVIGLGAVIFVIMSLLSYQTKRSRI